MSCEYSTIFAEKIDKLPHLPGTINELRYICNNENSNFYDFIPIIEKDTSLCIDILHLANSAFFGIQRKVDSIQDALRFIGMNSLVDYIAVYYINRTLRNTFNKTREINNFFKHSQQIALSIKTLGQTLKLPQKDIDFLLVLGHLHDVGRLLILSLSDKEILESLTKDFNYPNEEIDLEQQLFGTDHCYLGAEILKKWSFSERMQKAVLQHHTPLKPEFNIDSAYALISHMIILHEIPESMILQIFKKPYDILLNLNSDLLTETRKKIFEINNQE